MTDMSWFRTRRLQEVHPLPRQNLPTVIDELRDALQQLNRAYAKVEPFVDLQKQTKQTRRDQDRAEDRSIERSHHV